MSLQSIAQDLNPWWASPLARAARRFPVERDLLGQLLRHVQRESRRAALVLGPRQVGKSTLMLQVADRLLDAGWPAPNITYFRFDDERLLGQTTARDVADLVPVGTDPTLPRVLLLDEIQRAPRWDLWLKNAVDAGAYRIIATDSAASILRGAGRESGLGRWDEYRLETLSFREYVRFLGRGPSAPEDTLPGHAEAVNHFLATGGFPEHITHDLTRTRQRLREDIVDRAVRHDLAGMVGRGLDTERVVRLLVYLLQDSGSIFDLQARARDLGADHRTVRDWLLLLEDTMLVVRLEPHGRSATARLRAHPRYHATDHGLIAAFAPLSDPLSDVRVRGRMYEAAVFRHMRGLAAPGGLRDPLWSIGYFRRGDDLEIDFVLSRDSLVVAVEVTSSASVRRDKLERFRQACEALGVTRSVLIHGGPISERQGSMAMLSMADFLMNPEKVMA